MINTDSIGLNTVNVLIGANGSGKSRLLRKLCTSFLRRGENVIAIAPTIHDRFLKMPERGLWFFGARQGRSAAANVVRNALERAASREIQIIKNLTQALRYTGFDPVIGLEVRDVDWKRLIMAMDGYPGEPNPPEPVLLALEDREALLSTLSKWQKQYGETGIARLGLDSHSFDELDALSFAKIAQYEKLLRKTGTVSHVGYHLFRNRESFPLLEACSGELLFITTIAFISTHIEPRSIIAIDEPETSLHPTWQQNYVRTLLDLFHHYEPRILISTHSPIIISAAEYAQGDAQKNGLFVYQMMDGQPQPFNYAGLSLEAMYDRLFGLITPKNHYLSQRAVAILNELNSGERNLENALREIRDLRGKSYDAKQQAVLTKIENLARKVDAQEGEEDDDELH